eukprot:maker-scaffold309_size213625-snap-gene-0.17 protein:Tk02549 transcript:maker-scaffold309_size213625-snap-gene-0.17-mRNA-1 annotation:"sulfhydryl oxidase 2"
MKILVMLTFLTLWTTPGGTQDAVSLYSVNDFVTELVDQNVTRIYNSDHLWVVEMYAHWCGHCQRFASTWMYLAEELKEWSNHVQIAALNCAEQERCTDFRIQGTPTILVFPPHSTPDFLGVVIDLHERSDLGYLSTSVMEHLAGAQRNGLTKSNLPNLRYYNPKSYYQLFIDLQNGPRQPLIFILESLEANTLGLDFLRFLGPWALRNVNVKRVSPEAFHVFQEFFEEDFPDITNLPAVIHYNDNASPNDRQAIFHPNSLSPLPMEEQAANFVQEMLPKQPEIAPTTIRMALTSRKPAVVVKQMDKVYATDLERAVQYAITQEIAAQPVLTGQSLNAMYIFLDVVATYLPLRQEIKDFVVSLREWPIQAHLKVISNKDYEAKVKELERIFRPFDGTPSEWVGCRGSHPKYRGYPCALWTLFHALSVNAVLQGDPAITKGKGVSAVAKAMTSYIHHFFSCRHCAQHFAHKVQTLGRLPKSPQDSIIWIWQIHNMANAKLKGDLTEDPVHPKIIWPSPALCPECRVPERGSAPPGWLLTIDGTLWNLAKTAEYLVQVYRAENIVESTFNMSNLLRASTYQYFSFLSVFHFLLQKSEYQW